jgi:hypothetical protein
MPLCETELLAPGPHNLSVVPSFDSSNSIFWLDYIIYAPLPNDPLDSTVLRIQNYDRNITYIGDWTSTDSGSGSQGNETTAPGSSCRYSFSGEWAYLPEIAVQITE